MLLLAPVAALLLTTTLAASAQSLSDRAPADGHVGVPLWPAGSPALHGSTPGDIPTLKAYLPASNPTHTAVLIAPGGGYEHLALDHEGSQIGVWLASRGIAAFVLSYRLGPKYHHPTELGDAQRALRTIRARNVELGLDHVGMWGFSAGGHLAATAGTHFDVGSVAATDAIERQSSRPDFLILSYPVITMDPAVSHSGSVRNLLGEHPSQELIENLSNEKQVSDRTPPSFLFATTDDPAVPVMNSVLFYSALLEHHIPAEMHLFQHGRHGVGLAQTDPILTIWPKLLENWLVANGWMTAGFTTVVLPSN